MFKVIPVETQAQRRIFINFPYHFYREDPFWVPPLRRENSKQFDPGKNPFLDHCRYQLFLLEKDGRAVGRIAAFIDDLAVDFWDEKIGLFGYYECPEDPEASAALLGAASAWLVDQGMESMRGPWTFISQEWGLVVEGFRPEPVIMGPYNPAYYPGQLEAFQLEKIKDLLCYYISGPEGYEIPERILKQTDRVAKRYGITIRKFNMTRFDEEVRILLELSNNSIIDNWGYSPVTDPEAQAMAMDLKQIVQPRGVLFAEDQAGDVVGFAIALPDINTVLKTMNGRLIPLGWAKLLWHLPRLTQYRMFALGVIPEYQGRGVDALLYRALYESLYSPEMWMEINYVLEDNYPMNNAIKKLLAKPLRRYRIYQKNIS